MLYLKAKDLDPANLVPKTLKNLIKRTRKLRNKYRDLTQRQSRKGVNRSLKPARTMAKADLFQGILERFEHKLSSSKKKPAVKSSSRKKSAGTSKSQELEPLTKTHSAKAHKTVPNFNQNLSATEQPKACFIKTRINSSSAKRIHAFVGSRDKRTQHRNDNKKS